MSQYIKDQPPLPSGEETRTVRGTQRSGLALTSLILGIVSLIPYLTCFAPIAGAFALIFGIVAFCSITFSKREVKGKWFAIIGIACSVYSLWMAVQLFTSMREDMHEYQKQKESVPLSAFEKAEKNIRVANQDDYAFGNTPRAKALARDVATRFKLVREEFFSKTDRGLSLTDGQFLTHCELNEDTCAFLIHVPKLRKFDEDAKSSLCDIAWMLAQSALAETDFPEGGKLAVGVKGVLFYENIYLGEHVKEIGDKPGDTGRTRVTSEEERLSPFFPEDLSSAEPEPDATLPDPADSASQEPKKTNTQP